MTRSKLTRIFTLLASFLTIFQAAIPSLFVGAAPSLITLLSATCIFLVLGLTAWKQALSVEIRNGSLWPTIIIAIIATMGGLNDLIGAIPMTEILAQRLRAGVTVITLGLNIVSKDLWPSYEGKVVEKVKQDLTK